MSHLKRISHRFKSEWQTQAGVHLLSTPRGITGRWHYDGWGPHDISTRLLHLARGAYDVLIAFDSRANVYIPFRAMKGRIPLRVALWGDRWGDGGLARGASRFAFQRRLEEKWEKAMMLQADGVITPSQTQADLGREWGVPDARICWIPHGSPVDLIHRLPKASARQRIGLDGAHPVLGYMGHTLEQLPSFFPALQRLVRRYPQAVILCIGACAKDRAQVEAAGLASHFRFPGFVPAADLSHWLACADLFLIPLAPKSVNEYYRYPGKLGEYLAAGRPVVAPDIGETGRMLREEKVGCVVREDLADLEECLCEVIENHALAEQLGMQARRAAEERFAWSVLADRFEHFVMSLNGHGS